MPALLLLAAEAWGPAGWHLGSVSAGTGGVDTARRAANGPAVARHAGSKPNQTVAHQLRANSPKVSKLKGPASKRGDGIPERLVIPVIGVDTELVSLGLNSDGTMEVPSSYNEAGWFTGAPKPGDPGPAIIAGHVSSKAGPGVFYRLSALKRGDLVQV